MDLTISSRFSYAHILIKGFKSAFICIAWVFVLSQPQLTSAVERSVDIFSMIIVVKFFCYPAFCTERLNCASNLSAAFVLKVCSWGSNLAGLFQCYLDQTKVALLKRRN